MNLQLNLSETDVVDTVVGLLEDMKQSRDTLLRYRSTDRIKKVLKRINAGPEAFPNAQLIERYRAVKDLELLHHPADTVGSFVYELKLLKASYLFVTMLEEHYDMENL